MRAALDNDFLYKLARYDLLGAFGAALAAKGYVAKPHCLQSARYVLNVLKPSSKKWPSANQQANLRSYLTRTCDHLPRPSTAVLKALDVPGIDEGELLLLGHAVENADAIVFTGDKRALRAVASTPSLASHAAALAGRVIHLEAVIHALVADPACVGLKAVVLANRVDTLLTAAFSAPTQAATATAIAASVARLRAETGGLMAAAF